jgi:hypothetical protein
VVGGTCGVAVLAGPNGEGWNRQQGLTAGFNGLQQNFSWKIVRTRQNVRKLMTQGTQLFVLSDDRLERLELTSQLIAQGTVSTTIVAELSEEQREQSSSFSDAIITGPLAILATSFGLLRSGNGVDIRSVDSSKTVHWTAITMPEAAGSLCDGGPASRLFAVTQTGEEQDLINGGTLYVVNGYVGLNQTQLYRFAVHSLNGEVTDQTIQLFPDYFIRDVKTFFANPGEYRNYFVTDGALFSLSRSAFGSTSPFLELLSGVRAKTLWLVVPEAHSMGKLVRSSASGAWVASGDFGVRFLA